MTPRLVPCLRHSHQPAKYRYSVGPLPHFIAIFGRGGKPGPPLSCKPERRAGLLDWSHKCRRFLT